MTRAKKEQKKSAQIVPYKGSELAKSSESSTTERKTYSENTYSKSNYNGGGGYYGGGYGSWKRKKDTRKYHNQPSQLTFDWTLYQELLLYRAHSKSAAQVLYRSFLQEWIETHIPNVSAWVGSTGNLYVMKGNEEEIMPCVVSHLDVNQDHVDSMLSIKAGHWILGIDEATGKQCGCGHDK